MMEVVIKMGTCVVECDECIVDGLNPVTFSVGERQSANPTAGSCDHFFNCFIKVVELLRTVHGLHLLS